MGLIEYIIGFVSATDERRKMKEKEPISIQNLDLDERDTTSMPIENGCRWYR